MPAEGTQRWEELGGTEEFPLGKLGCRSSPHLKASSRRGSPTVTPEIKSTQSPWQHSAGTYLCGNPLPRAPTLFWASGKPAGPMAGVGSQPQGWKQEGISWVKLGQQDLLELGTYKLLAHLWGALPTPWRTEGTSCPCCLHRPSRLSWGHFLCNLQSHGGVRSGEGSSPVKWLPLPKFGWK